jgi:hypothetical protein
VISPGEGGSDDNSDGPNLKYYNLNLHLVGRHYCINNIWNKKNDTTMNVPGDNVVTDVISTGGGGSHEKSDGLTVLPSNSP